MKPQLSSVQSDSGSRPSSHSPCRLQRATAQHRDCDSSAARPCAQTTCHGFCMVCKAHRELVQPSPHTNLVVGAVAAPSDARWQPASGLGGTPSSASRRASPCAAHSTPPCRRAGQQLGRSRHCRPWLHVIRSTAESGAPCNASAPDVTLPAWPGPCLLQQTHRATAEELMVLRFSHRACERRLVRLLLPASYVNNVLCRGASRRSSSMCERLATSAGRLTGQTLERLARSSIPPEAATGCAVPTAPAAVSGPTL